MITFGGNMIIRQSQHFLRAGCHAYFAAFAVCFIDNDPTLKGHSYLLEIFPFMGLFAGIDIPALAYYHKIRSL
jgi:hypothetical protein